MLQKPSTKPAAPPNRPIPESYWVIPGRLLAGEYPASPFSPEHNRRRIKAFLTAGFDAFINLTFPGETSPYEPILYEEASAMEASIQHLRFPIWDHGLPTVSDMKTILDAIDETLAYDHKIYIHCYGGIGRTGTTIGCFLSRHGQVGQRALDQLAQWWLAVPKHTRYPNSPETIAQEDFVRNWREEKTAS